jgi:hypothetical protein
METTPRGVNPQIFALKFQPDVYNPAIIETNLFYLLLTSSSNFHTLLEIRHYENFLSSGYHCFDIAKAYVTHLLKAISEGVHLNRSLQVPSTSFTYLHPPQSYNFTVT